jgi:monovalent cation:H+ antiporter-2, CPA2 family
MSPSLLRDLAIILAASFPILLIGRRLGVPEVISYLVTGIAIGPYALGLVRDTAAVETIAEVGVALILFFVGLHIPLERLKSLGRTTFVSGSLQISITTLLIGAIAMGSGLPLERSAFFGIMVALSSTAVVLPILSARGELGSPYGRRSLGVLLFQDFALIPLILLVPAFATGQQAPPLMDVALRVTVAIIGVIVLVIVARAVVPRVFSHIAALGSREAFTAAAIVLIVATIAFAEWLEMSPALGAFAAGVVVAETQFAHDIGGILRPFRDFLAALFFASIGMLLHPEFVLKNLPLTLTAVLLVLGIKIAAAYPAFRAAGALQRTSVRAAFALAPIGEFSFLLAQEAKGFGILTPFDEQLFITVAVISLASTPLLVGLGGRVADRVHGVPPPTAEETSRRKRHIIIIGYGVNGQNVAGVLQRTHIPHVVVEEDPRRAAIARTDGNDVVVSDASDVDALESAGIGQAIAAVVAISDADATRRIVQRCRTMNEDVRLVVRTRYISEVEHLRQIGATEVIPEEFETSLEIVARLMRFLAVPGNIVAAQLRVLRDEGYKILRDPNARAAAGRRLSAVLTAGTSQTFLVMPDSPAEGRSLTELAIDEDHVVVPAMLRDGKPLTPAPLDEPLQAGDTLFLAGAHDDLLRVIGRLEER